MNRKERRDQKTSTTRWTRGDEVTEHGERTVCPVSTGNVPRPRVRPKAHEESGQHEAKGETRHGPLLFCYVWGISGKRRKQNMIDHRQEEKGKKLVRLEL